LSVCSLPLLPSDLLEDGAQAFSFRGIDGFHKSCPALKVHSKVRMSLAVLVFWTEPHAICQNRLQTVEVASFDVGTLVGNEARKMLTYSLAHDSGLAKLDHETFFLQDGRHVRGESIHMPFEFLVPRKCEVVGVTCVRCAD